MVTDEEASEKLTKVLNSVKTPHGTVDNVMRVHSLRPSTMKGHYKLYKSVLHDEENFIPTWFQETISSYVSIINNCEYSFANHWKNAKDLINDEIKSNQIEKALKTKNLDKYFSGKELALLNYAEKLTLSPGMMKKSDVIKLKNLGFGIIDYFDLRHSDNLQRCTVRQDHCRIFAAIWIGSTRLIDNFALN